MERRFDDVLTIEGSFVAKGKISCKVLHVKGDFYLLEGELYCQELYVEGDVYIRGKVHLNQEGTAPASCKVVIEGSVYCGGVVVAHGGEVTINEDCTITSIARLGHTRVKVMRDLTAGDLDCGELIVGGDVDVSKGMIDAKGRVYTLGDINSFEFIINFNNVFCGGQCTANLYSKGRIFEEVKDWKNLN